MVGKELHRTVEFAHASEVNRMGCVLFVPSNAHDLARNHSYMHACIHPCRYDTLAALCVAAGGTILVLLVPFACLQGCCDTLGLLWCSAYELGVERHVVPAPVSDLP